MKSNFKRISCLLLIAAMLLGMAGCVTGDDTTGSSGSSAPTTPSSSTSGWNGEEYFLPMEDGYNQVTIYWDYSGDLATADAWIWYGSEAGKGYLFYPSAYGCKTVINVPEGVEQLGFITRYDCSDPGGTSWGSATKDIEADRFISIEGKETVVYLKKGDANIYFSDDGGKTLYMDLKINIAGITSFNTIKYNINAPTRVTSLDQIKVCQGDRQIEVVSLSTLNNNVNHGVITLAENLDLSLPYTLEIEGYGSKIAVPTAIFDSEEFIANYTYDGDDLGAVVNGDTTTFKLWAPTASKVVLNLFEAGNDCAAYESVEMVKGEKGVWEYTANCGSGTYYTYTVTTSVGTQEAVDPYAKAAGVNGERGMVIDLDSTDPENWGADVVYELTEYTDAIIWEIHVRDFSNTIASSNYKGKYLAFTETGLVNSAGVSVGMDYLTQLGITHVHLLPVYDYASVDEITSDSFNWGYDPKNYNVPEGSYSTDPYHGEVRINEYKQMVQSLHNAGLGVIMDVVYNHTYDANSNLNKVVPYYYYRYTSSGDNTSASGCGNDTASERKMYRKYMVDSVSFWAEEYHLDGFRFDLMGLHDVQTMQEIEQAVHAINPNAIIYGEAWNMAGGTTSATMATQPNIGKITATEGSAGAVAVFNDAIRDGLKGSVFEKESSGYISGDYVTNELKVRFGISGGAISGVGWNVSNAAVINYMSAHDNNTLWDKLAISNPSNTVEERLAMNRLGAAILMISKGTPFWQAGEEMLRSKPDATCTEGFNENSYNASDAINNIDWEALVPGSNEYEMMLYYKGLIEMRKAYDIFNANSGVEITFASMTKGGMAVTYTNAATGEKAIVLINPTKAVESYTLDGEWMLVANGTQAGAAGLAVCTGSVEVSACSMQVYIYSAAVSE